MSKPKEFIAYAAGADGIKYGIDRAGQFWRLDKLDKRGIKYHKVGTSDMPQKVNRGMRRRAITLTEKDLERAAR